MKKITIKLTREKFNFKFKQYEGMDFNAAIEGDVVKYTITKDGELKEFGNTHIKDNLIYIPQIDAYIELKTL
jgi:hypothetical protein